MEIKNMKVKKLPDLTFEDLQTFFAHALGDYHALVEFELAKLESNSQKSKLVCSIRKTVKNAFEGQIDLYENGWALALGNGSIDEPLTALIEGYWTDYLLREGMLSDGQRISVTAGEVRQIYDMVRLSSKVNHMVQSLLSGSKCDKNKLKNVSDRLAEEHEKFFIWGEVATMFEPLEQLEYEVQKEADNWRLEDA